MTRLANYYQDRFVLYTPEIQAAYKHLFFMDIMFIHVIQRFWMCVASIIIPEMIANLKVEWEP